MKAEVDSVEDLAAKEVTDLVDLVAKERIDLVDLVAKKRIGHRGLIFSRVTEWMTRLYVKT